MIVRDSNEEKLTARHVETSNWESGWLLLKSDGMGISLGSIRTPRPRCNIGTTLRRSTASQERAQSRIRSRTRSVSCDRLSFTRSISMMLTCCVPRPNWYWPASLYVRWEAARCMMNPATSCRPRKFNPRRHREYSTSPAPPVGRHSRRLTLTPRAQPQTKSRRPVEFRWTSRGWLSGGLRFVRHCDTRSSRQSALIFSALSN